MGNGMVGIRQIIDMISMAHPYSRLRFKVFEKVCTVVYKQGGAAKLTFFSFFHSAGMNSVSERLKAIADT